MGTERRLTPSWLPLAGGKGQGLLDGRRPCNNFSLCAMQTSSHGATEEVESSEHASVNCKSVNCKFEAEACHLNIFKQECRVNRVPIWTAERAPAQFYERVDNKPKITIGWHIL